MTQVTLAENAAKRINHMMRDEPEGSMLRISVNGGGCSGFEYAFSIDQTKTEDDVIIERNGAVVLIDTLSLPFLQGSVIDFVDDLIGQSFKINNPNATSSCGCGTSFSI